MKVKKSCLLFVYSLTISHIQLFFYLTKDLSFFPKQQSTPTEQDIYKDYKTGAIRARNSHKFFNKFLQLCVDEQYDVNA